jgi:hypothetical protein
LSANSRIKVLVDTLIIDIGRVIRAIIVLMIISSKCFFCEKVDAVLVLGHFIRIIDVSEYLILLVQIIIISTAQWRKRWG